MDETILVLQYLVDNDICQRHRTIGFTDRKSLVSLLGGVALVTNLVEMGYVKILSPTHAYDYGVKLVDGDVLEITDGGIRALNDLVEKQRMLLKEKARKRNSDIIGEACAWLGKFVGSLLTGMVMSYFILKH